MERNFNNHLIVPHQERNLPFKVFTQGKNVSYETIKKVVGEYDSTTSKLWEPLQNSYNYFKEKLFSKHLPPVIISLNKARSKGYYKCNTWIDYSSNNNNGSIPEININPLLFAREPIQVMQTLVHEVCHHYHQIYGRPGIGGYHNIKFSKIMYSAGLVCSDTGKPGGKKTGRQMTHYMIEGGAFEKAFIQMPKEYLVPFKLVEHKRYGINPKKIDGFKPVAGNSKNKTKYTCLECSLAVWGKPDLNIRCGDCDIQLTIIKDFGK